MPWHRSIPSLFVIFLCASASSACRPESPPGATFTLRDSAGVSIVENRGEVAKDVAGRWSLSPQPTLRIGAGTEEEDYLLFRVWGATRLSDGSIAVVNSGVPDLRIFDPRGKHLRTFGTRGEGPGEFNSPVLMGKLPGDTLVVVDRLLRRIYLFDPESGFIRGATADPGIPGYLLTSGMFSSGSVLVWSSEWEVESPNGFYRFPVHYRSIAQDGTVETKFEPLPGDETLFATQQSTGTMAVLSSASPFGKSAVAAVHGDRFFYGSQDRFEIRIYNQTGHLVRLVRRDESPTRVTDAHVRAIMEEMVDQAEDNDQAREFRRMYREAPIPDFHPAHGSIYADALGFLWVEEYRLPGDTARTATIFDPDGRMVGSLELPQSLRVEEIGADYVLGRWVDELGVEVLELYDLTRPSMQGRYP